MTNLTLLTKGPLVNSEIWTVGTGGNYANFPDAINTYLSQPTLRNVQVTITALTGHTITLADQYMFQNVDAPNLFLDTQSVTNVDGTSFVQNFGVYGVFTAMSSRLGGINGQYILTVPTPGSSSAVVNSVYSEFFQLEFPTPSVSASGFRYSVISTGSKSMSYSLSGNGVVQLSGDNVTTILQPALSGNTSPDQAQIIYADSASEVFVQGGSIASTDAGVTAIRSYAGSEVTVSSTTINTAGRVSQLNNNGSITLVNANLNVDQTTPGAVFELENGSKLSLLNCALNISNATAGWTLFNLDDTCTIFLDNVTINSADWTTVSPFPVGQRFTNGGGIFGASIDTYSDGYTSLTGSENAFLLRPSYCSHVHVSGGPFNVINFTDDLVNLPLGATVRYSFDETVCTVNLTYNGVPWVVTPVTGQSFTITKTQFGLEATMHVDFTAGGLAGRPYFLPGLLSNVTTSYAVTLSDLNRTIVFDTASACTLNLPDTATVALPAGFQMNCRNNGAGAITVTPAGGDSVTGAGTVTTNPNKVFSVYLELESSGVRRWVTAGDLT